MRCPACGVRVLQESVYCHRCGTRLELDDDSELEQNRTADGPASRLRVPARELPGDRDDDEEIELWTGTVSWRGMIRELALATGFSMGAIAAKLLLFPDQGPPGLVAAVIAGVWLLLFLYLGYQKLNLRYHVTSQRLIHKHGILSRVTDRIEMIDVDDVRVTDGILQRLVGTGTIQIGSTDRTHPEISIRGIERVLDVASMIDNARRKERVRRGLHIESV